MGIDREWRARLAAFEWLAELGAPEAELTRTTLTRGFDLDGVRIPLLGPQGIWSPAGFRVPLSISTIPSGPYSDHVDPQSNRLRYAYRGTDPQHRDNVGLRRAQAERTPLVYFYRTDPGHYLANFPVYVVGDDPGALMFSVTVDEAWVLRGPVASAADVPELPDTPLRREYATRTVRQRLFQAEFRRRVVAAYRQRCALCSLRHRELLDAAHITADSEAGEPIVSNGMALCKLHHRGLRRLLLRGHAGLSRGRAAIDPGRDRWADAGRRPAADRWRADSPAGPRGSAPGSRPTGGALRGVCQGVLRAAAGGGCSSSWRESGDAVGEVFGSASGLFAAEDLQAGASGPITREDRGWP